MIWKKDKLGNHLITLTDYHANGSYKKLKENVTLLNDPDFAVMIRTTNFEKNDFEVNLKYVDEHAYNFLAKSKVSPGDILMNKIANAGSIYLMPNLNRPVSLAMNLFLLRTSPETTNQKFIYYYLKSNEEYIKLFAIGAAANTITKENVRNLEIKFPALSTQQKIASILSAYDDLIENNTSRIKILEEMAQTINKEWFVNFRFPGHEKIKFVDSPLGKIPEGWEVRKFSDCFELERGVSHKGDAMGDSGMPLINLKSVLPGGGYREDGIKYYNGNFKESHTARPGDIFIANTDLTQVGTIIGNAAIVPKFNDQENILLTHHLYSVRFKNNLNDYKYFFYLLINFSDFKEYARGCALGTTVLGLSRESIFSFEFTLPEVRILNKFESIVSKFFYQVNILKEKNQNLRKSRDLLLPKLMSGEVDVSSISVTDDKIN